jgi:hypothetical protein
MPKVVGIEEGDQVAAAGRRAGVARRAHPPIDVPRMVQVADFGRMLARIRLREFAAAVTGAVVDQDDLKVLEGLRQRALHGLGEIGGRVQEDDDDCHPRSGRTLCHAAKPVIAELSCSPSQSATCSRGRP